MDVDPLGLSCQPTITKGRIILRLLMSFSSVGWRTAWDILTGNAKLVLRPAPAGTHKDTQGEQFFGTNEAHVYTDRVKSNMEAAGIAAHEVTHVRQKLTSSTYKKAHEIEAFKAQRAVDDNFNPTDQKIEHHVNTHPAYKHVPN